jgi:hypothetical protein
MNIIRIIIELVMGAGLFSKFGSSKAINLSAEILQQIRSVVKLLVITFMGLILAMLGFHYFIVRLLNQMDSGSFSLTPSLIFLLVFISVCLGIVVYSTSRKTWSQAFNGQAGGHEKNKSARQETNPIETAISLYLLDLVKEREWKRQNEVKSNEPNSQSN